MKPIIKLPWRVYESEGLDKAVKRIPFLRPLLLWQGFDDFSLICPVFSYIYINGYMGYEMCKAGGEINPKMVNKILWTAVRRGDLKIFKRRK